MYLKTEILGSVLTKQQVANYAAQAGFPSSVIPTMVAIAQAESSLNTDAISPTHDYGLWQINRLVWGPAGFDSVTQWRDPLYNAQWAKRVYDQQGLTAWSTYNSGAYLAFMDNNIQPVVQNEAGGAIRSSDIPAFQNQNISEAGIGAGISPFWLFGILGIGIIYFILK